MFQSVTKGFSAEFNDQDWYVDNGATKDICKNESHFTTIIKSFYRSHKVTSANNAKFFQMICKFFNITLPKACRLSFLNKLGDK